MKMSYTSTEISFPGLGIPEFTVDRVAFTVFGRPVAWYGVIIAMGMMVAIGYIMWRTTQYKGIKPDDVIDFALFVIIFGVIGARLYYVLTSDHSYDSFLEVIAVWEGGLAIYGGIIAGAITALVVCRVKRIRYQCFFDMLAPAVMIAQAIGRWGNFCNGEAYGSFTDSFIGMELTHIYPSGAERYVGIVHPTFLYESLWNVAGFILLNIFYKKRKFDGQICLGYIAWYGFGRFFIEGLRQDSLWIGPFRISQVVGLLSFIAAMTAMIYFWFFRKAKRYATVSLNGESSRKESNNELEAEKTENGLDNVTENKETNSLSEEKNDNG